VKQDGLFFIFLLQLMQAGFCTLYSVCNYSSCNLHRVFKMLAVIGISWFGDFISPLTDGNITDYDQLALVYKMSRN